MNRTLCIASCVTLLASGAAGAAGGATLYSMQATARCVTHAGGKFGPVRRTDTRRIAFSDLAQRTSREARFGRRSFLLAFTRGTAEARSLRETLVVPDDPYVLRVKSNVVLMYRPADATALRKTVRCLRSA